MNSLDDLIRETLAARAHDVDGVVLVGPTPRTRRAGRGAAVATVLAVAAAIVVAVVLVATGRGGTDRQATPASPPAGLQWVSYHGITLTAPADWATGSFLCTAPDRSAVVIEPRRVPSCPAASDPVTTPADATVLSLGDLSTRPPTGDPTTVAGQPARRLVVGAGNEQQPFTQVQLPVAGVNVTISGPSGPADAVLASLRYTPVDPHGCLAALTADPVPASLESGRVDPGRPVTGAVCEYETSTTGGDLIGSRALTTTELEALTAGVSGAAPWTDLSILRGLVGVDIRLYRLTLADGSTEVVSTEEGGSDIAVTDGTHRAMLPAASYGALPGAYP